MQLDTASTCNTLPEKHDQSLIPPGQKITKYLSPSNASLFTYDNSKLKPMAKLQLLAETSVGYHLLTFQVSRGSHIQGKPPLLSGSDCVKQNRHTDSSCIEPYNHYKGPLMYGQHLSSWKVCQSTVEQRALQHQPPRCELH